MAASTRKFIIIGAISAALAIGLGAFGAHTIRTSLTARMLEIYHTAVFYHLVSLQSLSNLYRTHENHCYSMSVATIGMSF